MKLELLALKWAVREKFSSYLLGSKFTIIKDNNPLCHPSTANLGTTQQRWVAELPVFDFDVKYHPDSCNTAYRWTVEPEPDSEDADYDGCVAICNILRAGTALDLDLVTAGIVNCKISQLTASEANETAVSKAAQTNTPTFPGYSET